MNNLISNLPAFPNLDSAEVRHRLRARTTATAILARCLKTAINQVEELHGSAEQQVTDLLKGDRSDVHNVMIAVEKADIAFQLMMQVRNKIVSAYQEVSRMQF